MFRRETRRDNARSVSPTATVFYDIRRSSVRLIDLPHDWFNVSRRHDSTFKLHDAKVLRVIHRASRVCIEKIRRYLHITTTVSPTTNISVTIFVARDGANSRNVTRRRTPGTFLTVPMLRRGKYIPCALEMPIGSHLCLT